MRGIEPGGGQATLQGHVRSLLVLVLAAVLTGCEAAPTTPAPGSTGPSSPDASAVVAGTAATLESAAPAGSGAVSPETPGEPLEPVELPLPEPTLTEPFAIGEALYDPSRMDDAVVSLLDLMGVGIYARDGTLIRKGDERAAGDPWLYDAEVRLLIEMGVTDLLDAGDDGPTHTLAELHEQLAPLLADVSLDRFIAAYRDSYAANPDDLAPMVMLGQPLDGSARFTRTQLWLLFMDGFVELAQPVEAGLEPGALLARVGPRPRFSTAGNGLPPLNLPQAMSAADWQELQAHLLTANGWIKVEAFSTGTAHEGHGGAGRSVSIIGRVRPPAPVRSAIDGRVLLATSNGPLDGIPVDFYDDGGIAARHGSLAPPFSTSPIGQLSTDATGQAKAVYTPKQEEANGRGVTALDQARLLVVFGYSAILARAYLIGDRRLAQYLANASTYGHLPATGPLLIEWHTPGIEITIVNHYDVTVKPEPGGMVAMAHRKGADFFRGTLTRREDGTYRGTFLGITEASSNMEFVAGAAGTRCDDSTHLEQKLLVVAELVPTPPGIDPAIEPLTSGRFDGGDVILRFYPTGSITGSPGACQGVVGYTGPGPNGRTISSSYASFNDSHFTDPSLGFRIHLPRVGHLEYSNLYWNEPSIGVNSTFDITVDRSEGS